MQTIVIRHIPALAEAQARAGYEVWPAVADWRWEAVWGGLSRWPGWPTEVTAWMGAGQPVPLATKRGTGNGGDVLLTWSTAQVPTGARAVTHCIGEALIVELAPGEHVWPLA
jgi:hypothetical protein